MVNIIDIFVTDQQDEREIAAISAMGSGSSVPREAVPELVTREKAKELLGRAYDEERFEQESTLNAELAQAVVGKARFLELAGITSVGMNLEAWFAQAAGLSEKEVSKAMRVCDEQDIKDVNDLRTLFDAGKLEPHGTAPQAREALHARAHAGGLSEGSGPRARERLLLGYGDAPLRYNMSLARGADTLLRAVGQLICPRNPASLSSCIGEQAGTGATVFF